MKLNLKFSCFAGILIMFASCSAPLIEIKRLDQIKKEFQTDRWQRPLADDLIEQMQKWKKPLTEKMYVIEREPLSEAERIMLASLQGIVAKETPMIFMSHPAYDRWLEEIEKKGIKKIEVKDYNELIRIFKNKISGYVLCPDNNFNVATFYSYRYNVIIVPESIEKQIKDFKIKKRFDVREKDDKDLINEFFNEINKNAIITIDSVRDSMRDFAIANGILYFSPAGDTALADTGYRLVGEGVPLFGWGAPYGDEGADVNFAAKRGLFTIPADFALNLTALAGTEKLTKKNYKQKRFEPPKKEEKNVHYVTFMMSDGDNFNWFLDGVHRDEKYFMNKNRGRFPLSWMMPPIAFELAPIALEWYYDNATINDYFLCALSGAGYTSPSQMSEKALSNFIKITGYEMKNMDLDILVFLEHGDFYEKKQMFKKFIENIPELKGILYMDYNDYAGYHGDAYSVEDIPVVSFRYKLWKDAMEPDALISRLNNSRKEVHSIDAYSAVVIHAWSYGLNELTYVINNLKEDIRVVKTDEFFNLIKKNVNLRKEGLKGKK